MISNNQYTSENYPTYRSCDHALKYTLRVTLKHITPKIYRKFEVPSNITLRHLADLILSLMGWSGGHQNAYHIKGLHYRPAYQMTREYGFYGNSENYRRQEDYTIADVLSQKGKAFELEYDFGDSWCHEVKLSSVAEYKDDEPHVVRFVKGEGACPPEDVGGPWGYMDLLEIIQKKRSHKRLTRDERERLEWFCIEPMEFDPEFVCTRVCELVCRDFSGSVDENQEATDALLEVLTRNSAASCYKS